MLELLEGLERKEARIAIVETGDEAHVGAIVVQVIDETAAVGLGIERPADAVLHEARLHAAGRQLPQLLHAERVDLRICLLIEPVTLDEHLGEAAPATFGDDREARAHLGAGRVVRAARAVVLHAHVADLHAGDRAVVVEQRQRGGETREHVDAQGLGLCAHPLHQPAERDDEVAFVAQVLRNPRHLARAAPAQPAELVVRHGHADRQRRGAPLGQQRVQRSGLEHGARKNVRAERRALLEDADGELGIALLETNGGREAGRAGADDGDVVLHHIALCGAVAHRYFGCMRIAPSRRMVSPLR